MRLDRAFCAVGVVNARRCRAWRLVIPMVCRGTEARKLFRRGWFEHTFAARRHAEGSATVPGPDGKLMCGRFGIESRYRQLGARLAVTSSRDAVYRLLPVGVSVLLREWWLLGAAPTVYDLRRDRLLARGSSEPEHAQHTTTQRPTRT